MLSKRIASAVVGALILIGVVLWGVTPLRIGVALVSGLMVFELLRAHKLIDNKTISIISIATTMILSSAILKDEYIITFLILYLVVLFSFLVFSKKGCKTDEIALYYFFTLFIGFCMSCVVKTGALGNGRIWMIFVAAWGSDTAAYTFGCLLGKHKLIPAVSPKKTVEGAIGGVFGSVLFLYVYSVIVKDSANLLYYCLLGVGASCLAQLGDLSASAIKRKVGIKDYGNIMPGHGGMMDRFDSILLVAPLVYYFLLYFLER